MDVAIDWHFDAEIKDARRLDEMITSEAKKLKRAVLKAQNDDEKGAAVYAYYRRYYTLTLNKAWREAGINKSPTRDIILDYPWKECELSRFFCLKLWEKINK